MTSGEELGALATAVLRHARQHLDDDGGFQPFAALLQEGGAIELLGATRVPEGTSTADVLDGVYREVLARVEDGAVVAAAVCTDVRIPHPDHPEVRSDAIRVALEHRQADPVDVFMMWERTEAGLRYAKPFTSAGARRVM